MSAVSITSDPPAGAAIECQGEGCQVEAGQAPKLQILHRPVAQMRPDEGSQPHPAASLRHIPGVGQTLCAGRWRLAVIQSGRAPASAAEGHRGRREGHGIWSCASITAAAGCAQQCCLALGSTTTGNSKAACTLTHLHTQHSGRLCQRRHPHQAQRRALQEGKHMLPRPAGMQVSRRKSCQHLRASSSNAAASL